MHTLSRIPVIAALGIGLAIAGCGDDDETSSSASPPPPPAQAASASQTLQLSADPGGELKFDKTKLTAKAGSVKIVMDNPSQLPHGVGVDGNGVDVDGPTVGNGERSTITADLKPGTYEFYCTVDAHQKAGMKGTLTVK